MSSYGERLRDLRARAGYRSVKEAAHAAGIDKETLYDFEAGKVRQMQARTRAKFFKLAELYGVPPSDVLPEGSDRPPDPRPTASLQADPGAYTVSGFTVTMEVDMLKRLGSRGVVTATYLAAILDKHSDQAATVCAMVDALLRDIEEHGVPPVRPKATTPIRGRR